MPIKPAALALSTCIALSSSWMVAPRAVAADAAADAVPADVLRAFSEAYQRIKADYVDDVSSDQLIQDAIQGMLGGLDPHSKYLDRQQRAQRQTVDTARFDAFGMHVEQDGKHLKVVERRRDTAAAHAGLQIGDVLVDIDGRALSGMSAEEVYRLLRGRPGTEAAVTVLREHDGMPYTLSIQRPAIQSESVRSKMLDNGVGYIRIKRFETYTAEDMIAELTYLQAATDGGLRGLVLDLRNNPGGVVRAAIGVVDAFVSDGTILSTQGRRHGARSWKAQPDDLLAGAPLAVLVNGRSASSSEIVAGALQDLGRAVILGARTYGKGTVQSILPLNAGGAVKMTTSRYFTPSGRSIQAVGIAPDIALTPLQPDAGNATPRFGDGDYALNEAVNLVKGIGTLADDGAAVMAGSPSEAAWSGEAGDAVALP